MLLNIKHPHLVLHTGAKQYFIIVLHSQPLCAYLTVITEDTRKYQPPKCNLRRVFFLFPFFPSFFLPLFFFPFFSSPFSFPFPLFCSSLLLFFEQNKAVEFSKLQICVDLFLFSAQYTDVASLMNLPKFTAGQLFYYPVSRTELLPLLCCNTLR